MEKRSEYGDCGTRYSERRASTRHAIGERSVHLSGTHRWVWRGPNRWKITCSASTTLKATKPVSLSDTAVCNPQPTGYDAQDYAQPADTLDLEAYKMFDLWNQQWPANTAQYLLVLLHPSQRAQYRPKHSSNDAAIKLFSDSSASAFNIQYSPVIQHFHGLSCVMFFSPPTLPVLRRRPGFLGGSTPYRHFRVAQEPTRLFLPPTQPIDPSAPNRAQYLPEPNSYRLNREPSFLRH